MRRLIKVSNQKTIHMLSRRFLRKDDRRNLIAILAIALTALLFTSLVTISATIQKSMKQSEIRINGTSHAYAKNLSENEYKVLEKDKEIKSISYNVFLSIAWNKELTNIQSEIRYAEDENAKSFGCYPKVGRMPNSENELATSTIVLDALGIKHRLGEHITLELSINGVTQRKSYILSGYWKGDKVATAQEIWVSKQYCNRVAPVITGETIEEGNDPPVYCCSINFKNQYNIDQKVDALIKRCGFNPKKINISTNSVYADAKIDKNIAFMFILVITIILVSGYLIIYNIFYISVNKDIKFYGLLKTIGTTSRQLKRMVRKQAFVLASIGIPLGLLLGYLTGWILTPFVMKYMGNVRTIAMSFHPFIFIFSAVFTLLTVYLSCFQPCFLVARLSPQEAVKYVDSSESFKRKKKKSYKVTPFHMAFENVKRARKKAIIVIASLSLSLIILNGIYKIITGFNVDLYLSPMISSDFEVRDKSMGFFGKYANIEGVTNAFLNQIKDKKEVNKVGKIYAKKSIQELEGNEYYRIKKHIDDDWNIYTKPQKKELSNNLSNKNSKSLIYGINAYAFHKLEVQKGNIDWKKFQSGDYVIVEEVKIGCDHIPCYKKGDRITLNFGGGKSKTYKVMAIGELPYTISYPYVLSILTQSFYLPEQEYQKQYGDKQPMTVILDVKDSSLRKMTSWMKTYCKKVEPNLIFTSKQMYLTEFNQSLKTVVMVGGTLIIILGIIGILNFINTIATSILARKQEFAMLEAVGMTKKQLKRMLNFEGILYGTISTFFAITVGVPITNLIVKAVVEDSWYYEWRFTVMPIIICFPFLLLVTYIIPNICYKKLAKDSIVERFKLED
ncbi:ABC transporter permease [Anaeromicropila herbilytica]|uniref:Efflux ABC transporter permease n=1 Tax=Anaeromicropila herbilytica TaxID=2785025 RepID=A0A7R7EHK1_9FIRM|nr:ABC transporter permease [Anaeromicropila herbilytica]BCN28801.1 efflux ABC transporter permease [Anaeromicropila herbilytica]